MGYLGTKPANALATTEQIGDGAVQTSDIATSAVTQAKLASGVAGNGPAFSAYGSGVQTITTSVWTKLNVNTKKFDTNNNFDSTTNYRFTPTVAGYYQVNCVSVVYPSATGSVYAAIYKNGVLYNTAAAPNGGVGPAVNVSSLIYLNGSTDYIEQYAYQNSGGGLSSISNEFSAFLARSA